MRALRTSKPTIMRTAAKIGNSHNQYQPGLRVFRATSRANPTSEYSMAAIGPRRPRQSITTGSRANNQNHRDEESGSFDGDPTTVALVGLWSLLRRARFAPSLRTELRDFMLASSSEMPQT